MGKFFDISKWPETIIGVLVEFDANGYTIGAGKFKKTAKKARLVKEFAQFEGVEQVIKKFGLNLSYVIQFSGRGVLTKSFAKSDFTVDKVLHGQDPNGFLFNQLNIEETTMISFTRKGQIEEVLDVFKKKNVMLIDYSIGELHIGSIPINGDLKIEFNNKLYHIENNTLLKIEKSELNTTDYIDLEDIKMEKKILPLLGNINGFGSSVIEKSTIDWINEKGQKENIERKLFHYVGGVALAVFLMLLVGNYFYLEHINDQIIEKNNELQQYSNSVQEVSTLNKEKKRKRLVLKSSGILNSNYLSYYVNDIVSSMPPDTKLTSVNVFPVESIKESKKLVFNDRQILLSGTTNSSSFINSWINKINKFDWIQKVELDDYTTNYENVGEFRILIQTKFE